MVTLFEQTLSSRIVIIATNCSTIYRTPCAAVAPRWYASFYNGRRLSIFLAVYTTTVQLFTDEHARLKRNAEEFAVGTSGYNRLVIIGQNMLRHSNTCWRLVYLSQFCPGGFSHFSSGFMVPTVKNPCLLYYNLHPKRLTIFPLSAIFRWQLLHSEMTL